MSVGMLAHLVGTLPYKESAKSIGSLGFRHIQLALWKAFSDMDVTKPGRLSPGLVGSIKEEFDKHGVSIPILGCYLHLFDRNEEARRENIERFKELIRYARLFGASMVAAETGKSLWGAFDDSDWLRLKATVIELIEEAEKWGVFIAIEPADGHLVDSPQAMCQLLSEIPSSHLGVLLDPGNLLTPENIGSHDDVLREAFDLVGSRILACHAKDRYLQGNGELQSVAPGEGRLNYPLFMQLLNQYKPGAHVILEWVKEHQLTDRKDFVERLYFESKSIV